MLIHLVHDLRFALRGLRQRPAFSLAVIAMIALGVGATTTVFSVVDGRICGTVDEHVWCEPVQRGA